MFKNFEVLILHHNLLSRMSDITWTGSAVGESGNENESGGEVFLSCCPSPFPGTWAFPLSFESSLEKVL